MRNHASCHAVADFFLVQIDPSAGDSICNLKIQKLCYYAQGWSLALHDRPMFAERLEAWAHGPAVPPLYGRFKHKGWENLDPFDLRTNPFEDLSTDDQSLLRVIWQKYGKFSGRQLEDMTHSEQPWLAARGETPPGVKCTQVISNESMSKYFKSLLNVSSGPNSGSKASRARVRTSD